MSRETATLDPEWTVYKTDKSEILQFNCIDNMYIMYYHSIAYILYVYTVYTLQQRHIGVSIRLVNYPYNVR